MRTLGILLSLLLLFCAVSFGQETTTPPSGQETTTPPSGQETTTPPSGKETTTPPSGKETTTPPSGKETTTPPSGEETTTPPSGSETTTPLPTTAAPPATPPPCVEPEKFKANVTNSSGSLCILVEMAVQFSIVYNRSDTETNGTKSETTYLNIPPDVTATGSCGESKDDNQTMKLEFEIDGATDIVELTFSKADKNTVISVISATFAITDGYFPDAVSKESITVAKDVQEMKVAEDHSYKCAKEDKIVLSDDVTMKVSKVQIQSHTDSTDFLEAVECESDTSDSSDIVPIAVGCALAGLVILVLIAYLIGRRRSRQKGYQSV